MSQMLRYHLEFPADDPQEAWKKLEQHIQEFSNEIEADVTVSRKP